MLRGADETGDVSRANSIASLRCLLVKIQYILYISVEKVFGRKKQWE